MEQRDARAGPEQFERRDGGGVLRAHHQHVVIVVRMRLLVIVDDLVQLFAGDIEHVRNVVIAGGENDLARAVLGLAGCDEKVAVLAVDRNHALVLTNVEAVIFGDAAIIFQRFGAAGLFVERSHRQAADFEQLRRGEEHHVRRIVVERIDHAALFDEDGVQAALLQLNATGQASGTGANDDDVELLHGYNIPSTVL